MTLQTYTRRRIDSYQKTVVQRPMTKFQKNLIRIIQASKTIVLFLLVATIVCIILLLITSSSASAANTWWRASPSVSTTPTKITMHLHNSKKSAILCEGKLYGKKRSGSILATDVQTTIQWGKSTSSVLVTDRSDGFVSGRADIKCFTWVPPWPGPGPNPYR